MVLHPGTRKQIEEIETWIQHGETLMTEWEMAPKLPLATAASFTVLRGREKP